MAAKKELFVAQEPDRVPCAADTACRFNGRLWIRHLQPNERICVDHYYIAINNDGSLAGEPVIPPRPVFKSGVTAKPVSGGD
jgi:hypothetical protein